MLNKLVKSAYGQVGPLAQSVEQRTFNPWVVGSKPTGPTLFHADLLPPWHSPRDLSPHVRHEKSVMRNFCEIANNKAFTI